MWTHNEETSTVRIESNRSIHLARGKAFRRQELWTDHARVWIDNTKDRDGDPYFKLMTDAPAASSRSARDTIGPFSKDLQLQVEGVLRRCPASVPPEEGGLWGRTS
jgi:hypothetical protein